MRIPDLFQTLRSNPLFAVLSDAQLRDLESRLTVEYYGLGDIVIRRGDEADGFCLIYSGRARVVDDSVSDRPVTVAVLSKGDTFGEQALINRTQRSHTVRAAAGLTLLKLSNQDFDWLASQHPSLPRLFAERIGANTEFNFLRRLNLLSQSSLAETQALLGAVGTIRLNQGEYLFREGDTGRVCYLVREGCLHIRRRRERDSVLLASLGPGEMVGEMSLLFGQPRSADAVAADGTVLLSLTSEVFDRCLGAEGTRRLIAQHAANRLLQNETLLEQGAPAESETGGPAYSLEYVKAAPGFFARRYPVARAASAASAGLACLAMVDEFHHRAGPEQAGHERRDESGPEDLVALARKAEDRGYLTRMLHLDAPVLASAGFPAIAEGPEGVPVVLYSASAECVILANPIEGLLAVPRPAFDASWNGKVLALNIVPEFNAVAGKVWRIFRQFTPLLRRYKNWILTIAAIGLLIQLFGIAGPLFSQIIVDKVLVHGDRSLLHLLLLGMLFVIAFQMGAGALRDYLSAYLTRQIGAAMQLRFFQHVLMLSERAAARWRTGDYLVRFGENEKILRLVSQTGFKLIIDSASVMIYLVLLFAENGALATVALFFVFGFAVLIGVSSPMLRAGERRVFDRRQWVESHLVESTSGIQTIKSLALEDTVFAGGSRLITDLKFTEFRFAMFSFKVSLIGDILNQAATIAILAYGAKLALSGSMTTGQLVAFTALFGATLAPLTSLVKVWDELQELRVSFERTSEVLAAETEQDAPGASTGKIAGRVRFDNVVFRYPGAETDTISGFDLEILPGQKVALVGRSGSGKTTIASLLLNLYQPDHGSVLIDGVELNHHDRNALRRQIGTVEQNPHLFTGSIRENIAMADPSAGFDRVVAAATLAGAHQFIDELPMAYDTQIGERGIMLSGGQRQRIAIARALIGNPRMLLLDEATSALDTESEGIIQRNLETVMAGRTTLVIAHRLSTVRHADRIVVMEKGQIVETGTHTELMERKGLYYYLNAKTD